MLSLAKLAGADQRYYLDQAQVRTDHAGAVSSGAEDYYLSGPEAAGAWTGSAAAMLGLRGRVTEAELRAVLSRVDPRSGNPLKGSVQRARVPGFDLMFSVPKSASVLFGIGGATVQRAVLDAQAAAVGAALRYLEAHACRSRRGAGGYEIVPGEGFVGAAFRHRTSRAGDPQVHTHVLIANATRIPDGSWAALDGRAIYAEARTAGFIHEAVFRRELSERLGVGWTRTRNGIGEVDGVSRDVIEAFSRRRSEISAQVAAWGIDTAAARQSAAVQTRRRKDYGVTPEKLAPEWRRRAAALGLDASRVRRVTGRQRPAHGLDDAAMDRLLSRHGLTAQQSSFDRRDVMRAVAESARDGATLEELEAFAAAVLSSGEVVTLAEPGGLLRREDVIRRRDGRLVSAIAASPRYSTVELLAIEQRVIDAVVNSADERAGVATGEAVEASLRRRPTTGDDQAHMVRRLCRDGAGVQVVVGPPGTGKTFALAAARDAWQASGVRVIGAAVARRAAVELTATSGIEATSVAALLLDLRTDAHDLLNPQTVLVVDEAGMLGTRALAELVDHTRRAGAKLVLVGDPAQIPEIDAGGAFRALCRRTDPIRLETNRRQARPEDRRLLQLWRTGDLRAALTIATDAGDLVLDASPQDAVRRLVRDYATAVADDVDAVMLAPRRSDVRLLNELARAHLVERGAIGGPTLVIDGRTFACGDRVVLRRNAADLEVQNGTRGTVVAVDTTRQRMTIALGDGSLRMLPSRYLHLRTQQRSPSIEHGYALTAHLAQGMTVDRAFVLGSEAVYREWGYTAWSRARARTRFYVVDPEISEEHHTAAPVDVDRFDEIVRRLDRSQAQQLAVDLNPQLDAASRHTSVSYLDRALGPRPESLRQRRRWDRAARRIAAYRAAKGITDPAHALGPEPPDAVDRLAWRRAQRAVQRAVGDADRDRGIAR